MYLPSTLFTKAYRYAMKHYDHVAILSAKYGLLLPEEVIEPYELTLKTMGEQKRREWAERVIRQLDEKIGLHKVDRVYFHAGYDYREHLSSLLRSARIQTEVPLEGLSFGRQLHWYDKHRQ